MQLRVQYTDKSKFQLCPCAERLEGGAFGTAFVQSWPGLLKV